MSKQVVPNVTAKRDDKEQARLQAQIGNMRKQNGQFVLDEVDKTYTLERQGEDKLEDGTMDLKAVPAVYFSGCKNGQYTIDHRVSKILVENCENLTIVLNGKLLTSTIEIWKCKGIHLQSNTKVKTLQLDIMTGMKVTYKSKDNFQSIVWQDVDTIDIAFEDEPNFNLNTGFAHMIEQFPDSEVSIDQFIVRFVPELGEGLTSERCVRLKNGHLSTEREAAEWDKRNVAAKENFKEQFLKEAGIKLNRNTDQKKILPNAPCSCGSGKKYKKCCRDKQVISGLHESQKEKEFTTTKDGIAVQTKKA